MFLELSHLERRHSEDHLLEWFGWSTLSTVNSGNYHLYPGTIYRICTVAKKAKWKKTPSPLVPITPSDPPSVALHNGLDPPWASWSPALSWYDNTQAPPLASEPWTPPQPFRPFGGATLAPCSLFSTMDHHPTGIPGLWISLSYPSLQAPPSLWIHRWPQSLQPHQTSCVTLALCLLSFAWVSTSHGPMSLGTYLLYLPVKSSCESLVILQWSPCVSPVISL